MKKTITITVDSNLSNDELGRKIMLLCDNSGLFKAESNADVSVADGTPSQIGTKTTLSKLTLVKLQNCSKGGCMTSIRETELGHWGSSIPIDNEEFCGFIQISGVHKGFSTALYVDAVTHEVRDIDQALADRLNKYSSHMSDKV